MSRSKPDPAAAQSDGFSTLFDFLPIGAYRSSPEGRQLRANAALVRLNGYDSEAQLLASVVDIATECYVDPTRRAALREQLEREGVVRGFVSEIYRHKTRERCWIKENAHVVRNPDGTVRYYEGTVEEVSDSVRAQQAGAMLRDNDERWKLALEASGDGVWDWDLVTGKEVFSPRLRQMYGYGDELADLPDELDDRTHPEDLPQMLRDRDEHLRGLAPSYVNEHRVQCQDGQWKWVLTRGLVIGRDAQGRPLRMIGTHTDITERKQAEALRLDRDRAEAANRAKSQLLSRVSHELRTPLNAVLGFSQLMVTDPGLSARHRAWAQQIIASGQHLLGLVEDVLDMSSAQTGQLSLRLGDVAVAAVVEATWAMVVAGLPEPAVVFINQARSPLRVRADARRLKQVLANLLSNAVKYNHPGGQVTVFSGADGARVLLQVRDTGRGMDAQQLTRLFNAFERLGAEHSRVEGRGIGLALSLQLVEAMGGSLAVDSTPGLGSSFSVWLPASEGAAPPS